MIEVCAEEDVSPEHIFFYFAFFAVVFIIMTILEKNPNKSVKDKKTAYKNYRGSIKKRKFLMVFSNKDLR